MRKYGFIAALVIGGACRSGEGPEPQITTTVVVNSTPTEITVNETAQASAVIKDQNGQTITGKTVTWTSLNQSIATVTPTGSIRGVGPGNATIQGTVDDVSGTLTVTVIPPLVICENGPQTVALATGEVRVISSVATKGCLKISSTPDVSQYLVIAAKTNPLPDQVSNITVKSDEGETVPSTSLLANPLKVAASLSVAVASDFPGAVQSSFEAKWRLMERRELDFSVAKRAYAAGSLSSGVRQSLSVAVPAVGDKTTFKVPAKFDASGNSLGGGCDNFTSVTATVKFVSNRAILYLDDAAPAGGFTNTDFQEIAKEFDDLIYPTDVEYFGNPSDLDGNSRIIILYTPLVNKLTKMGDKGFVGGFFFVGDLFPATGENSCAQSNAAEIFYALAPDPTGSINNNVRTTAAVRQGTRGTLAHEFQHMINGSERIRSTTTNHFEATWLDEALAHFAEDLNGRVLRGFSETGNLTDAQMRVKSEDYAAFFFQNFARFRFYLSNPPILSPTSFTTDTSLAARGAAWALLRYTSDHYAPGGDVKAFIKSLVPGPDTGVVNLIAHAGNVPFDTLIAGWMVANYADDAGIAGLATKYTYKSYNIRDAVTNARTSSSDPQIYPLIPTTITGSGFVSPGTLLRSGSGAYFIFARPPNGAARSFRFLNTGDLGTAAAFSGASYIVLRVQ